jgi:hypothetical protein
MEETLRFFFVIIFFLCIGILAIFGTKRVQQTHLKLLSKKNPYKGWVEGDIYLSLVRFVGLFFLVMSIAIFSVRIFFPWIPPINK